MMYREIIINGEPVKLIPRGLCACGCGRETPLAKANIKRLSHKKGQPIYYLNGHASAAMNGGHGVNWKGGRHKRGRYWVVLMPEHPRADDKGYVFEHVLIAEKALGKFIPFGVEVHHFTPTQLVICQDQGYHKTLHRRQRAYEACGHANWRKCWICKEYDDPKNLYMSENKAGYHQQCRKEKLEHPGRGEDPGAA